jgi:hypothetical protein
MRVLFFLLLLPINAAAETAPLLTSFYEIILSGKHLHNQRIEVVGFLSAIKANNGTSLIYLCSTEDACFSVSKDRLAIRLSDEITSEIYAYDKCHVALTGLYRFEPSTNISRSYGELVDVAYVSLAVSRNDYSDFNNNCAVWNDIEPDINANKKAADDFNINMDKR